MIAFTKADKQSDASHDVTKPQPGQMQWAALGDGSP